ncbi:glycosyltransferase family 4 protein [Corallococcus sp. bb12-1]|uniref:glycosyltransferase family 4 protein n=1 Tax=Corallococcus sp. bb12-1 TaxID=2996784 RepID=UPI00226F34D0|nr:glycosyltransferase family 4 protein [Corallococcus sp. bb12-1]MCY1043213.1 glycosyltransferase family 4 protein [Corallococcus sp. bb12-1]
MPHSTILHVRSTCGLYGAERALLSLAGTTPSPWRAQVCSLVSPGRVDVLSGAAREQGLDALTLEVPGRFSAMAVATLASEVRRRGVGVVHAHDYKSLTLAAAASALSGVPLVATYHGDTGATPALVAYEGLARVLGNCTTAVAAVSRELATRLRRYVHRSPVVYIPNALPLAKACTHEERLRAREALGLAPDVSVIALVGRLSVEKGPQVLFDALRILARTPGATVPTLLLVGDGPLRQSLEAQAQGLPVHFLGFRSDVREVYAAADAVVMPSLREGMPLVALEAMAAGRPLIASGVGELPHVLGTGRGLVVPPGDAGTLASALAGLLAAPGWRERMAGAAREYVVTHHAPERMAERYVEALYLPALEAPSAHAAMGERKPPRVSV